MCSFHVMQPQEQLNYSVSGNLFSEHHNNKISDCRSDQLSQWVEHVTKQLIEETDDDEARKAVIRKAGAEGDEAAMGLLTLLFECAVAISLDNLGEAHRMLLELSQTASPYGASSAERVVAYFARALSSRVVNSWIGVCAPIRADHASLHAAFHVYNAVSPLVKFAHFTSNQAILEACSRQPRLHLIDVDIMQGLQWPALFHILATRPEGPPSVRMTGMGSSGELLQETGKQLSSFARRLGIQFEFQAVERRLGDLADLTPLNMKKGEAVAVQWVQHAMYDATGADWKAMRVLRGMGARVVTLVEQEIAHGGSFLDRFVAALHYYSTVFDAVGGVEEAGRNRVEHGVLHREINNVVAVGGPARSGEEKMGRWRGEMAGNGFVQMGMSGNAMAQAQLILNMFPAGYRLLQGDGTLSLGWKDTSLYTVSAWTSPDHHFR